MSSFCHASKLAPDACGSFDARRNVPWWAHDHDRSRRSAQPVVVFKGGPDGLRFAMLVGGAAQLGGDIRLGLDRQVRYRLATVASTHSWISRLTSRRSRPPGATGSPMTTRIVPGFFNRPRRGQ